MRPPGRRRGSDRLRCFEVIEPRICLSGTSVADFHVDHFVEQVSQQAVYTTVADTHDLTGLDRAREEFGFTGVGQTVVIIDSGIAYDHQALGGGLGAGFQVVGGFDFTAERDADPYDDGPLGSHGTHVAGIIASNDSVHPGVAPGVDLVALRVFDDQGQGQLEWIEEALRWVHAHRNDFENPITTVNLSLGTKWNLGETAEGVSFDDELAQLQADGIFVAVAAGNSFAANQQPGLSYPATSRYVVPVASVDQDGSLSYFSQRDRRVIAAPGRAVLSTVPDYLGNHNGVGDDFGRYSGTSMAAPYVAAASVLLREAYQFVGVANVSQDMIYNLMVNTADTVYDPITARNYHRLNLGRAIDAIVPAGAPGTSTRYVDWGTVGQKRFEDNRIDATGQWFTVTASAGGLLTTEAIFNNARGNVDLELFDANHRLIRSSQRNGNYERIDVTARAGETFYLRAYARAGTNDAVDFRVTNLLRRQGKAIHVSGTAGDDSFTFRPGATDRIVINEVVYQFDSATVDRVTFDGLGGFDEADLFGTKASDSAVLRVGSARLSGPGYDVRTIRVESALVRGQGGWDRVDLYDSAKNDTFFANPTYATLYGPGFKNRALSFERVRAMATGGGRDVAWLRDSAGNDTFVTNPVGGRLFGPGFSNLARFFEEIRAHAASGGIDVAKLFDSAGNDTFVANPDSGTLSGPGFFRQALSFDGVHAYATSGGHDVARLRDSAGSDVLVVSAESAALFGAGFYNRAKFFEEIHARSQPGGSDRAVLRDSTVDDYFQASGSGARLSNDRVVTWISGFEYIRASATRGGTNHTEIAAVDYILELDGDWS